MENINGIFIVIASIIKKCCDPFILIFGAGVLVYMINCYVKLSENCQRIKELMERRNKIYEKNAETHNIDEKEDKDAAVTPDTIRSYETKFNDLCSKHDIAAQMIPVFPLLGILGTVAALILAFSGDSGLESQLGTAMTTTLSGLIWAIVLKIADAFPSKTINDVDVMLDDFYRKIDLAEMFEKTRSKK